LNEANMPSEWEWVLQVASDRVGRRGLEVNSATKALSQPKRQVPAAETTVKEVRYL
jgi:hypothetical protein